MKAEYVVRRPRSTSAAFRGFVLSETAKPTLGRKHVMDQRRAIPRTAVEHENEYDDARRKVLPKAIPPIASPAAARWRREFFLGVRERSAEQQPPSRSLKVWAGAESLEARVMLTFAELLGKDHFGDFRVLRAHLKDRYDFVALYTCELGSEGAPKLPVVDWLHRAGYGIHDQDTHRFYRYAFGEFKAFGDGVFDDFDEDDPRKAPDAIDLLICWDFDNEVVDDVGWVVEEVSDSNREFKGQTHTWRPGGRERRRSRGLPVISLEALIERLVNEGELEPAPEQWADPLPEIYF